MSVPNQLSALEAAAAIRDGALSAEELTAACLARIDAAEPEVRAWVHLDRDHALAQARSADEARARGAALGPLHGVPVGVKDIFDTADFPTEDGSPLHAGRTPAEDATAVARLRAAGAIILGKTVTTEFAVYHPGPTRNPHDPTRTPGGSSSGSAAAVAAGMVPLAIGSQTNGSVIRPAAFCGVVGYKPSHGAISRHRVLQLSRTLDHVGVFARNVGDAALLAEALWGHDPMDPDTRPAAAPRLLEHAGAEPPVSPRLGFAATPMDPLADGDTLAALAELREALGDDARETRLPRAFAPILELQDTVMDVDLAHHLAHEYATGAERLSDVLRSKIEHGRALAAIEYLAARDARAGLIAAMRPLFEEHDVLVTPAAPGVAPRGLEATGNPAFCTPWSFCGLPAITLPLLEGEQGLPLGVQLVAAPGDDARLLRTASWLARRVQSLEEEEA